MEERKKEGMEEGRRTEAKSGRGGACAPRLLSPSTPLPCYSSASLLLFLTILSACSDTVAPYAEDGLFPFALFGYLDTAADTQYVRVTPVRRGRATPPDPAEIEVALVRTSTGERTVWQGRPIRLDDGTSGYGFFAAMPIAPGATYRLEASHPGGAQVSTLTRVPEPLQASVGEVTRGPLLFQEVVFPDERPLPLRPAMRYRVVPAPGEPPREVVIPYGQSIARARDSLRLTVRLSADRAAILEQLGRPENDTSVVLLGLGLAYERLSSEWPPPDPPTRLGDGIGFFGSMGRFFKTWTLPDSTVTRLGFALPPP